MNFSDNTPAESSTALPGADAVLAREAGVPFQPQSVRGSGVDPFVEWLSLMEVVQMLCPVCPERDQPMRGDEWRL